MKKEPLKLLVFPKIVIHQQCFITVEDGGEISSTFKNFKDVWMVICFIDLINSLVGYAKMRRILAIEEYSFKLNK